MSERATKFGRRQIAYFEVCDCRLASAWRAQDFDKILGRNTFEFGSVRGLPHLTVFLPVGHHDLHVVLSLQILKCGPSPANDRRVRRPRNSNTDDTSSLQIRDLLLNLGLDLRDKIFGTAEGDDVCRLACAGKSYQPALSSRLRRTSTSLDDVSDCITNGRGHHTVNKAGQKTTYC